MNVRDNKYTEKAYDELVYHVQLMMQKALKEGWLSSDNEDLLDFAEHTTQLWDAVCEIDEEGE